MASLFRNRFSRPVTARRRRPTPAQQQPCEPLEQRLVLAANLASGLSEVTSISIDTDAAGPAPIVFEHADFATTDAGVLVVKSVANGYVQKWDASTSSWIDITNEPVSGDPRDLLRFLAQRTFQAGDRLQWVPAGSTGTVRAFDIVNWSSDTTPVDTPDVPRPAAVSRISVSASSEPGTLEVDWTTPASGDVTSYTVRIRSGAFTHTIQVAGTSATFTNLAPLKPYAIDVWASNDSGNGPVETAFHTLLDIRTVGDQVTAWDIRRSLLPAEPTDPQGNLLTPLASPWGDRLGFPGVSYEAIWAAQPPPINRDVRSRQEIPPSSRHPRGAPQELSAMDDAEMWFFMDRIADPGILSGSFEFECPECGFCCEMSYDAESNSIYSCPGCETLVDVSGF